MLKFHIGLSVSALLLRASELDRTISHFVILLIRSQNNGTNSNQYIGGGRVNIVY